MAETETIWQVSSTCNENLKRCLDIPRLSYNGWAENRLVDFKLWSAGAGAFADGKLSLDERLAPKPEIRHTIINLLVLLNMFVEGCIEEAQEISVIKNNEETDGHSKNTSEELSPQELEARKDVEVTLDQIIRVTVAIRKAGSTARFRRADRSFNSKIPEIQDLRTFLELIVHPKGQKQEGQLSEIQLRLIQANLRRRHRFLYAKKHSRNLAAETKLAKDTSEIAKNETNILDPQFESKDKILSGTNLSIQEDQDHAKSSETVKFNLPEPTPSVIAPPSATAASAVGSTLVVNPKLVRAAATVISRTTSKVTYPRPPPVSPYNKIFKCPCCHQSLPIYFIEPSHWKKHIASDILPYTCVLPGCPVPSQFFLTRKDWERHIHTDHGQTWKCPICEQLASGETAEFSNEVDIIDHLKTKHLDSVSLDEIPMFTSASRATKVEALTCPICPGPEPETDGDILDHIAQCVHDFALRSLPLPQDEDAKENYFAMDSENSKVNSKNSSSLSLEEDRDLEGLPELDFASDTSDELEDYRYMSWPAPSRAIQKLTESALESIMKFSSFSPKISGTQVQEWISKMQEAEETNSPSQPEPQDHLPYEEPSTQDIIPKVPDVTGPSAKLDLNDYTVAWFCGLPDTELVAARAMLDTEHDIHDLSIIYEGSFIGGSIGGHNIVILCMPPTPEGKYIRDPMKLLAGLFPNIQLYLFVGVGSGINTMKSGLDVRLGDVVISWNRKTVHPALIQYKLIEERQDEIMATFKTALESLDPRLQTALEKIIGESENEKRVMEEFRMDSFQRPPASTDRLFYSEYQHQSTTDSPCSSCDTDMSFPRAERQVNKAHYGFGTLLLGDRAVRDSRTRTELAATFRHARCIYAPSPGINRESTCLYIRGISDYGDSHANKSWQLYASAAAAAFTRALLSTLDPSDWKPKRKALQSLNAWDPSLPNNLKDFEIASSQCSGEVYRILMQLRGGLNVGDVDDRDIPSGRQMVFLCGLPGSGKSFYAMGYAYRNRFKYKVIFRLDYCSKNDLEASARAALEIIVDNHINYPERGIIPEAPDDYNLIDEPYRRLALCFGLKSQGFRSRDDLMAAVDRASAVGCLKACLSGAFAEPWLLILENYATDPGNEVDLGLILPPRNFGHVIVTCPSMVNAVSYPGLIIINLSYGLYQENVIDLLQAAVGRDVTLAESRILAKISGLVGGHPSFAKLIGSHLRDAFISFNDFAENLDNNLNKLLEQLIACWDPKYRRFIFDGTPSFFLQVLCCMANIDIAPGLIEAMKSTDHSIIYQGKWSLEVLQSRFFISKIKDDSYLVHPLIHRYVRHVYLRTFIENALDDMVTVFKAYLSAVNGGDVSTDLAANNYSIWPHVDSCNELFFERVVRCGPEPGMSPGALRIGMGLAQIYADIGDIPSSERVYKGTLEEAENWIAPHIEAEIRCSFAKLLEKQGRYDEALDMYQKALPKVSLVTLIPGPGEDVSEYDVKCQIAALYTTMGQTAGATGIYNEIAKENEDALQAVSETTEATFDILKRLIDVYKKSGDYQNTYDAMRRLLLAQQASLGRSDPTSLKTANDLVTLLQSRGRNEEALENLRILYADQAVYEIKTALSVDFISGNIKLRIADLCWEVGKVVEALMFYYQALVESGRSQNEIPPVWEILKSIENQIIEAGDLDHIDPNDLANQFCQVHSYFQAHAAGRDGEFQAAICAANAFCQAKAFTNALEWCNRGLNCIDPTKDCILELSRLVCVGNIYAGASAYAPMDANRLIHDIQHLQYLRKAIKYHHRALHGYLMNPEIHYNKIYEMRFSLGKLHFFSNKWKTARKYIHDAIQGMNETLELGLGSSHELALHAKIQEAERELEFMEKAASL